MFYENELRFLRETLGRCHMRSSVIVTESAETLASELEGADGAPYRARGAAHTALTLPEPQTVYRYTDRAGRRYIYFALPSPVSRIFIVGPFLMARAEGDSAEHARERSLALPVIGEGDL